MTFKLQMTRFCSCLYGFQATVSQCVYPPRSLQHYLNLTCGVCVVIILQQKAKEKEKSFFFVCVCFTLVNKMFAKGLNKLSKWKYCPLILYYLKKIKIKIKNLVFQPTCHTFGCEVESFTIFVVKYSIILSLRAKLFEYNIPRWEHHSLLTTCDERFQGYSALLWLESGNPLW